MMTEVNILNSNNPFKSIPDPSFYIPVDSEKDPAKEIFSALGSPDNQMLVLTGPAGSGKTILLRFVAEFLKNDVFRAVFIAKPSSQFHEMLREIIVQLDGAGTNSSSSPANPVASILEAGKRAAEKSQRLLVIVDDYSAVTQPDFAVLNTILLQSRISLTPITFLIAGNSNLKQRILSEQSSRVMRQECLYFETSRLSDPSRMDAYINGRLRVAGLDKQYSFPPSTIDIIYQDARNRNPKALNSLCRLSISRMAGCGVKVVSEELVSELSGMLHADPVSRISADHAHTLKSESQAHAAASGAGLEPTVPKGQRDGRSGNAAMERLASQVASDNLRHVDALLDPFEAWCSAKDEILSAVSNIRLGRRSLV